MKLGSLLFQLSIAQLVFVTKVMQVPVAYLPFKMGAWHFFLISCLLSSLLAYMLPSVWLRRWLSCVRNEWRRHCCWFYYKEVRR